MITRDIRRNFLDYFKKKGHFVVPSSSVVPHEDPTLLFNNAGMNQFKDVFLGAAKRDYTKAASCQKCIRAGGKHNDLENVGHTSRHLTFFEMLGNFSFGDYFKKEAIDYAWDVTLNLFGFDPDFIYATVLHSDDESFELWKKYLPEKQIVRMGEKDNFWAMGETGPCGSSSELLYDRGPSFGNARSPAEDPQGERFFEFWNLVFMEFNRKSSREIIPLPKQSVDTGAGLERVVALKMQVSSLFQTDILRELIAATESIFGIRYDIKDPILSPAFHVIADHMRSLSFAISDGATPSNIERGYVLRKILRRAVRYGRMLGAQAPFLAHILPRLISVMGDYPELKASENRIAEVLTLEEENFFRTLKRGGQLLNTVIEGALKHKNEISAADAFKLKDTYGLPLEEIKLLAIDANLTVDTIGFAQLEEEAKERSRKTRKESQNGVATTLFEAYLEKNGPCQFVGYHDAECEAKVTALIKEGVFVETLRVGDEGIVLLDTTPFYAEKGGQIGDQGTIIGSEAEFSCADCQTPFTDVVIHEGVVKSGTLTIGAQVKARVDQKRRQKIANNHTATHLLHFALQKLLGAAVKQAGSLVEPNRLRFDFNHHKALSEEEINALEMMVNNLIRANTSVTSYELDLEEANKRKEIKQFFGEKYGKRVRVVETDESKELCGGIHTSATGTIGLFKIVKESSVAAGVRRIDALTGIEAEEIVKAEEMTLKSLGSTLKVQPAHLLEKIDALLEENKTLAQSIATLRKKMLSFEVEGYLEKAEEIKGSCLLIKAIDCDAKELKNIADALGEKRKSLALFLITKNETSCSFVAKVSADLIQKGISANEWLKMVAPLVSGKGGGKNDLALGGGTLPEKTHEALKLASQWIQEAITKS